MSTRVRPGGVDANQELRAKKSFFAIIRIGAIAGRAHGSSHDRGEPSTAAARDGAAIRVRGRVQGVGFRPAVCRLAGTLGLGGFVHNDGDGVVIEVEGSADAVGRFMRDLPASAPRPGAHRSGRDRRGGNAGRDPVPASPPASQPVGARRANPARPGALRGLPARAERSQRPAVPLSVHQLHRLRAALHHRARGALRPAPDHDGRIHALSGLHRASTPIRSTGASTPSPTPVPRAGRS